MRASWTDLNAYVDGELPPDAAAEIARAIADDREIARQVAVLARLKAVTADVLTAPADEMPSIRIERRKPGRWNRSWSAVAAALAIVSIGGIWSRLPQSDPTGIWLDRVEERHAQWLAADASPAPVVSPGSASAKIAGDRIPDLGLMRLELAHVGTSTLNGHSVLYVGYVGANGCRLGLWIGPAPTGLSTELVEHREAGAHIFSWRVGDTAFAVIAHGMDTNRLKAIAGYLEGLSRESSATRLADGFSTDGSAAPCLG